jgi:hypothetical protein
MATTSMVDMFIPLREELGLWQAEGRICTLWWRDDDLVVVSPELHRMRQVSEKFFVPVLVAVIPSLMDKELANATKGMHTFVFCQHGFAHENHAPVGLPNSEFPQGWAVELIEQDLASGRSMLVEQFGERFFPIFVPPWNAFREDKIDILHVLGYLGISQYGPRSTGVVSQFVHVNTHVDIVDWAVAPVFPESRGGFLVDRLTDVLRRRRLGIIDTDEPTGILTHHRAMLDDAWQFIDYLLAETHIFPCVQWMSPHDVFLLE